MFHIVKLQTEVFTLGCFHKLLIILCVELLENYLLSYLKITFEIIFSSSSHYFSRFFWSSRFFVWVSSPYLGLASNWILSELGPSAYHSISSTVSPLLWGYWTVWSIRAARSIVISVASDSQSNLHKIYDCLPLQHTAIDIPWVTEADLAASSSLNDTSSRFRWLFAHSGLSRGLFSQTVISWGWKAVINPRAQLLSKPINRIGDPGRICSWFTPYPRTVLSSAGLWGEAQVVDALYYGFFSHMKLICFFCFLPIRGHGLATVSLF